MGYVPGLELSASAICMLRAATDGLLLLIPAVLLHSRLPVLPHTFIRMVTFPKVLFNRTLGTCLRKYEKALCK